jgi:tRNA modification GTPase
MSYSLDDTIAAIASPPGGAARGIVRMSGPKAVQCAAKLFRPSTGTRLDEIRRPVASCGALALAELKTPLPGELYLWPGIRSYTRQPMAELHTLGSPPLLECVLRAACAAGSRVAQPGEFTLRAFLSGRLDLTQAEAVLGVIDAASSAEFAVALRQMSGGLSAPMTRLRDRLLDLLAQLEAGLDFVEDDIEFITPQVLAVELEQARREIDRLAAQMASRTQSGETPRVVLTGWPNVGKSSLFNALLGKSQALVSEIAGTTRDYLTAETTLDGQWMQLIDTAGMEQVAQSGDAPQIEAAAQQFAHQQRAEAQVRLLCLDASRLLNDWERERLSGLSAADLVVLTKCDRPRKTDIDLPCAIATSAASGAGLAELRRRIVAAVSAVSISEGPVVAATAARCHESLRSAAECLNRSQELLEQRGGDELIAAEIRLALHELGKVVGAVYTDDLLDRIFSRFCIGK